MAITLRPSQALRLWQQVALDEVVSGKPDLSMRQMAILLTIYLEPPPHTVRGLAAKLASPSRSSPGRWTRWERLNLVSRHRDEARPAQRARQAHGGRRAVRRAVRRRDHRQGSGAADLERARQPAQRMAPRSRRRTPARPRRGGALRRRPAGAVASRSPICAASRISMPRWTTQLLFGDAVQVFDEGAGWSWVQAARDGYVGYVRNAALGPPGSAADACRGGAAQLHLSRAGTEVAGHRLPFHGIRSAGGRSRREPRQPLRRVRERRGDDGGPSAAARRARHGFRGGRRDAAWTALSVGRHAAPSASTAPASSSWLSAWPAARCCAIPTCRPRRSARRSSRVPACGLRRGDLVFWKGHVGIMTDGATCPCQWPHDDRVARAARRRGRAHRRPSTAPPTGDPPACLAGSPRTLDPVNTRPRGRRGSSAARRGRAPPSARASAARDGAGPRRRPHAA